MRLLIFISALFLCAFSTAGSTVESTAGSSVQDNGADVVVAASGCDCLADVVDSVVVDLDATKTDSYSGSGQTWSNLIASPADGEIQTAYDFTLGTDATSDTTDPTHTGTGAAAYFSLDGGDWFDLESLPTTIAKMHRSDVSGTWIALSFRYKTGSADFFWGNRAAASDDGLGIRIGSSDTIDLFQSNGASTTVVFNDALSLVDGTDYIMIVSWDGTSSSNNAKIWLNSTTASATASQAFQSDTSDSTSAPFSIGSVKGGTQALANGTRVYHFSAGNEYLTDAKATDIANHISARQTEGRYPFL